MKTKSITLENWTYGRAGASEREPAVVPGDVARDYFRSHGIEDFEVGLNYKNYEFLVRESWEYRSEFNADDLSGQERVYLRCNGVDTFSDVFLNGEKLGSTENMFLAYEWEIKSLLRPGKNEVRILIKPYFETRPKGFGQIFSIFAEERVAARKAQFHTGWDWSPFGVPACGIWLPVEVRGESGVVIRDVRASCKTDGTAVLFVELSASAPGERFKLEIDGRTFEADCTGKKSIFAFRLEEPRLWFPNGYGRQERYDYRLTLESGAAYEGRLAFREVRLDESPLGPNQLDFRIVVNGIPVFCRGSNWVPCERLTGVAEESRYAALLKLAAQGNVNMLRVWGGGIYERDFFYDECDRLGIMVFQEVMFACSDIPADPDFQAKVVEELEYQIPRLRNHPCIVLWSGGNEMFNSFHCHIPMGGKRFAEYVSRGMVESMTDVPYITASPFGYTDILNDRWSGDGHDNALENCILKGNAELLRSEIRSPKARFTSECCMFGPGRYRNLKKYIPADKLWPLNEVYADRYLCNPYSESPLNFAEREKFMADGLFGECRDAQDFVKKGMTAQAEVLRAECDFIRAGHGTGFLSWMFDDCWPTGSWALVDYYLDPKPAYFALKRAFRPLLPILTEEEEGFCTITVANDFETPRELTVEYGMRRLGGAVLLRKNAKVTVSAHGTCRIDSFAVAETADAYCFARIKGTDEGSETWFPHYWKDLSWKSEYDWTFFRDGRGYKIRITAGEFLRQCNIEIPRAADATLSDNYFDVEAGDVRTILVTTDCPLSREDIIVRDWNDDWK